MLEPYAAENVERVAAAVLAGGVVAYPTETFYALGADPRNARALDRIVEMKGREPGKPLLLIVSSLDLLREWVVEPPANLAPVAERFWPGPLTVVLQARRGLNDALLGAEGTIAIRLSPHLGARALIDCCGVALTGTSANRAGASPARTAGQVRDVFASDKVGEILDGGTTAGGAPSTILDLTSEPCRVLRRGAVSEEQIAEVVRLL